MRHRTFLNYLLIYNSNGYFIQLFQYVNQWDLQVLFFFQYRSVDSEKYFSFTNILPFPRSCSIEFSLFLKIVLRFFLEQYNS